MMRLHYFQHVSFEGPDMILDWALERKIQVSSTKFFKLGKVTLPNVNDADIFVVMGGPMGADETASFHWLESEKSFIKEAIASNKLVLGICLGAQLIAASLGARVYKQQGKEIGWFPVNLTLEGQASELFGQWPATTTVLHWHGDTFDLPEGAVNCLSSRHCKHQAFVYGRRVAGLQFHLETSRDGLSDMVTHLQGDIHQNAGESVQSEDEILGDSPHLDQLRGLLYKFLDKFIRL
ncbi:MAG: amidotransferase [Bdellovibrio sp.]|nr:MAG: amidotransferase [Bdellovibrio sp.]